MRQTASAESFIAKGAWVSVLALAEAVRVLDSVYELSSVDQARAIEMLLSHQQLTVQDGETIASALALFRTKPSLGFSDCLMLEMARKAGHLPLGTFDRNLGKIDGAQKL
jgi:predicted nucleic-acid-binding protein